MVVSDTKQIARMIKLSQNENPFGASPAALKAIADNYHSVYRYPDIVHEALKNKLARKYGVSSENVIIGAGSVEIADLAIKSFVDFNENIVTSEKTFVAYGLLAGINRRECIRAELQDNTVSPGNLISLCDDKTRVTFIANPNNPTGTMISHDALRGLLGAIPGHVVVVIDEAYAEYVDDRSYPDSFKLQREFKNLIILRTFSKIYGLAGLRIGYAIANRDIIQSLESRRTKFSVNRLAASAALAAIEDSGFVKECALGNDKERKFLYTELTKLGVNVVPSHGNFVMLEFAERGEKTRIHKLLDGEGVLVRDLGPFGVEKGLRMTVGRPEENKQVVSILKTHES